MFDIAYETEANIEAASIIIDREWEKSKNIKDLGNRGLYLSAALFRPSSVFMYFSIIFHTHGGC